MEYIIQGEVYVEEERKDYNCHGCDFCNSKELACSHPDRFSGQRPCAFRFIVFKRKEADE